MIRIIQHTDFLHDTPIRGITLGVAESIEDAYRAWGRYKVVYYCRCVEFRFIEDQQ